MSLKLVLQLLKINDLFFEFILNQYFRKFQNGRNLKLLVDNQDTT